MKLKDLFTMAKNKNNAQVNFSLKSKQLKKLGMTPEQLLEHRFPKPKTKFYKK